MTLLPARLFTGWPARCLAVLAGLMAALAHPPFGLLPGLLGYALMMALADRAADRRSAFFRGWLAGTAYFAVGTWWVAEAFYVDAANQGWMAPFAVLFMATGLALFWGAAAALYRWLAPSPEGAAGPLRVLVFAGALTLLEYARGHVLTGFPWNLPGETWRAGSAMSQGAALFGAYGLTWVTVAIAAAPALLPRRGRAEVAAYGLAAVTLAGLFTWGAVRLAGPEPQGPAPRIRIVQADIRQTAKYDPAWFREIVARYTALTARPAADGRRPDIVVWPEGAIPAAVDDYLGEGTWTRAAILEALQPGQVLLVGAYREQAVDGKIQYFNTFVALRRTADGLERLAVYDKHRLVPFGEYMPAEPLMTAIGFKQLVHVGDGFSSGPPPRPVTAPGLPALQPLICYESLFPGFTRQGWKRSGIRAGAIVNVSNDAWYGVTSGPWQNLNLSSYRAIEEGMPMLRATPTGVSAVIDGHGESAGRRLGQGVRGVIDVYLPDTLDPTLYSKFGNLCLWLFLALSAAACTPRIVASALKRRDNPGARDA